MYAYIDAVASFLPDQVITNQMIEEKISLSYPAIQIGLIESMTGVHTRRWIQDGTYASDLAIQAGIRCLASSSIPKEDIDLLIFASASQDVIEPATANIVQKGLGLTCPVFDVKNACNSFMNGIEIADAFIKIGKYKNVLICSGETPSQVVLLEVSNRQEFKNHFAGYTLGDAGACMLLSHTDHKKGILYSYFYSQGESRDLVTILGGGSRSPRNPKDMYFCGNPMKIREKFVSLGSSEFDAGLDLLKRDKSDIKRVYAHQVAMSNFDYMQETLGIQKSKFAIILPELGNIASCCIPTSLARDIQEGRLEAGDKIILMGFASGFSYGLVYYEV